MLEKLKNIVKSLQVEIERLQKKINGDPGVTSTTPPKKMTIINVEIRECGSITYSVKPSGNGVSLYVDRGEKIIWTCDYPFTIYYGATSPITHDKRGMPTVVQHNGMTTSMMVPYIIAKKNGNTYATPEDTFICRNTLKGAYKYFVSVSVHDKFKDATENFITRVCVDDPETIVPRPRGGEDG